MAQNGYAWWYVDALSADGTRGLTIIAFIGSVFSPYYALARARGMGDPEHHVAMNVALYGSPHGWAMTERGRTRLSRSGDQIAIGASSMRWDGEALTIEIDESTVPLPSRLRGRIVLRPRGVTSRGFALDAAARHRWQPIAPISDVDVIFEEPAMKWRGTGYFDTNEGEEPLEAAFRSWTWSRFDMGSSARIFYDVVERDGREGGLSLAVRDGAVDHAPSLPFAPLPRTRWGITRRAPCDLGGTPVLVQAMESAPFYARSAIRSLIDGQQATGVHESLSCARVASPLVRLMLPFRMFRRAS